MIGHNLGGNLIPLLALLALGAWRPSQSLHMNMGRKPDTSAIEADPAGADGKDAPSLAPKRKCGGGRRQGKRTRGPAGRRQRHAKAKAGSGRRATAFKGVEADGENPRGKKARPDQRQTPEPQPATKTRKTGGGKPEVHEAVQTSTDTGGNLKDCAGEMKGVTLALAAGKTEDSRTGEALQLCMDGMKAVTQALTAGKTEDSRTGEVLQLCMDGMKAVTQALTVLSAATARMGTGAPNAQSAGGVFEENEQVEEDAGIGEVAAVVSLCPSPYRARVPKKKPARALARPDTSDAGGQAVPTAAASSCPPIPDECDAQPSTQHVDVARPDTSEAGGQAVPTAAASSCPPIPDECDAQPSTQHVDVAQPDTSEAGGQALPTAGDADAGDAID